MTEFAEAADRVTGDSQRILGRPPRDMHAFVEANADRFRDDARSATAGSGDR